MSTDENWQMDRHTVQCISPVEQNEKL